MIWQFIRQTLILGYAPGKKKSVFSFLYIKRFIISKVLQKYVCIIIVSQSLLEAHKIEDKVEQPLFILTLKKVKSSFSASAVISEHSGGALRGGLCFPQSAMQGFHLCRASPSEEGQRCFHMALAQGMWCVDMVDLPPAVLSRLAGDLWPSNRIIGIIDTSP